MVKTDGQLYNGMTQLRYLFKWFQRQMEHRQLPSIIQPYNLSSDTPIEFGGYINWKALDFTTNFQIHEMT